MDDRTKMTNRRRVASIALFALLLTLPAGIVRADVIQPSTECDVTRDPEGNVTSQDAGNDRASATWLKVPSVCRGTLAAKTDTQPGDEQDWYKIEMTVARKIDRLNVVAIAPLFAVGIKLLHADGVTPVLNDEGRPYCTDSTPRDTCISWISEVNETYYLVLTREVGEGSYALTIDGTYPQHDCGTPGDAGDNPTGLTPTERSKLLTLPLDPANPGERALACDIYFDNPDPTDGFQIHINKGTVFTLNMGGIPKTRISSWSFTDPAGVDWASDCGALPGTAPFNSWGVHECKPSAVSGKYLLLLNGAQEKAQGFVKIPIDIRLRQDDCANLGAISETPEDAPDVAATPADRLEFSGTCNGTLDAEARSSTDPTPLDKKDLLAVRSAPSTLTFTAVPPVLNCITMRVTPPGGATTTKSACGPLEGEQVATTTLAGGNGLWTVDIEHTGLTVGAPSTFHKGGAYSVIVEGALGAEADCGTPADVTTYQDPNFPVRVDPDTGRVTHLREWTGCSGDLRTLTDEDAYLLPGIAHTDIVQVDLGDDDAPDICLFDPVNAAAVGCGKTVTARADTAALAGTWKIKVKQGSTPKIAATYALTVSVLSQDDCGNLSGDPEAPLFVDAGNTPATATPLGQVTTPADAILGAPPLEQQTCNAGTPGRAGNLRHATLDAADWYSVTLDNQYTALVATVLQEQLGDPRTASDFDLCVIAPDGVQRCSTNPPSIADVVVATPSCPIPESPTVPTCRGSGEWKIGVLYKAGPLGAYRLAIAGRN